MSAAKPHDGSAASFPDYFASRLRAPLTNVRGAYERRRAEACELLGITVTEYNARAQRFVDALLARHPEIATHPYGPVLAFGFASHVALKQARASAAKAAEPPAPAAPAPLALTPVALPGQAPANDVTPPPAAPVARRSAPSAVEVWARLRAEGLSRQRFVGTESRSLRVSGGGADAGATTCSIFVSSAADIAVVRRAVESFGLPVAEFDRPWGDRHFVVYAAGGPLAKAPSPAATGVVRWPGRDDYPAYAAHAV